MNLTTEEQRTLTIFLNECWHELKESPFMDEEAGTLFGWCSICDERLEGHHSPIHRLDFSDWRVVGRVIEKCTEAVSVTDILEDGYAVAYVMAWYLGRGKTKQEAICRAVLAWITEGKW